MALTILEKIITPNKKRGVSTNYKVLCECGYVGEISARSWGALNKVICKGCGNYWVKSSLTVEKREHKKNQKEYLDKYREKNREKINERQRQYRKNHIGERKEKEREYAQKARLQPGYKEKRRLESYKERAAIYGISVNEYDKLLKHQNGCCAICGRPPTGRRLDIDHEHQKNEKKARPSDRRPKIRGLLCHRCNRALGLLSNDTVKLSIMAENLVHYCSQYITGNIINDILS